MSELVQVVVNNRLKCGAVNQIGSQGELFLQLTVAENFYMIMASFASTQSTLLGVLVERGREGGFGVVSELYMFPGKQGYTTLT